MHFSVGTLLMAVILTLAGCGTSEERPDPIPSNTMKTGLIPRETLFHAPDKVMPRVSPDGRMISYLAPHEGAVHLWIRTLGKEDDHPLPTGSLEEIRAHGWAADMRHLYLIKGREGQRHLHALDLAIPSSPPCDLTPGEGVDADLLKVSKKIPHKILVSLREKDHPYPDVYLLDLFSGALLLDTKNPGSVVEWMANSSLEVLAGRTLDPDGGGTLLVRNTIDSEWRSILACGPFDSMDLIRFSSCGRFIYVKHNLKSDLLNLYKIHLIYGDEELLFRSRKTDVEEVLCDLDTGKPMAVSTSYLNREWHVLDSSVKDDLETIGSLREGAFSMMDRNMEDRIWLVSFIQDNGPISCFTYDRDSNKATLLFVQHTDLLDLKLAKMKPELIRARDGTERVCHLTLPPGKIPRDLPLVLLMNGGPWARKTWGFNPDHQWLANRGYAVLSVNLRGSPGFHDLEDAVAWATRQGFADRNRVAVLASSVTQDLFCFGVNILTPRDKDGTSLYLEFPLRKDLLSPKERLRAFAAAAEGFLAKHLGGRFQPITPWEQALLDRVMR